MVVSTRLHDHELRFYRELTPRRLKQFSAPADMTRVREGQTSDSQSSLCKTDIFTFCPRLKQTMHIRRIQYARVPQIRLLNHNFRPEQKHLVVTLDVEGYRPPDTNDFLTIYQGLADLFPTLHKHSCCEEWENTPLFLREEKGVAIKWVNEPADVAHLVEHVIVDMQCAVSGMRICSGITCGHKSPENRFDLFVECEDPKVGAFAAHFATYLVAAMFSKPRLSHRYRDIVRTAQFVATGQNGFHDGCELAARMHWSNAHGHWVYAALTAFGMVDAKMED